MTLVSGRRSALNPNAPLYIPAAVRQVEDFSAEWWQLITTASWFRDYWLSQRQGEDGFVNGAHEDFNDIADLLPDTIDLDADEDFLEMEDQFEEFILSAEGNKSTHVAVKGKPENGSAKEAKTLIKSLSLSTERANRTLVKPAKNWEKPAKNVSPKCSPRCIQQPRRM